MYLLELILFSTIYKKLFFWHLLAGRMRRNCIKRSVVCSNCRQLVKCNISRPYFSSFFCSVISPKKERGLFLKQKSKSTWKQPNLVRFFIFVRDLFRVDEKMRHQTIQDKPPSHPLCRLLSIERILHRLVDQLSIPELNVFSSAKASVTKQRITSLSMCSCW